MEDIKGTVCVTGGTGYVASWMIMRLLQHGYSVRATIRSNPAGKFSDHTYIGTEQMQLVLVMLMMKPQKLEDISMCDSFACIVSFKLIDSLFPQNFALIPFLLLAGLI